MSTHNSFEELVETKQPKHPKGKASATGPGSRLRFAREQAKLTRSDVAAHTRIKLEMIEAIEKDDYSYSPSLVFVRGWLRAYAKLVNLSGDEIVEAFNKLGITDPDTERPVYHLARLPTKAKRRRMRWFSLFILLIMVTLVVMWWHSQKEPPTQLASYFSMNGMTNHMTAVEDVGSVQSDTSLEPTTMADSSIMSEADLAALDVDLETISEFEVLIDE